MPGHISPKELKRDRFVESVEHGAEYAFSHARAIWIAIGAAVILVVAIGGWRFWSGQQAQRAGVALDEAMKTFQARLRTAGEPEEPGEVTFIVEKLKYQDARRKFDDVAQKYSLTTQGTIARYYSALCSMHLGEMEQASAALRSLAGGSNAEVASLANLSLAEIAWQAGKTDDAAKLLTGLMDKPTALVPRARAEFALAGVYRKSKPAEAAKLYEQIKKEFPDTPLFEEADRRLAEIGPSS
ncbi:MAG TPA: tetratricopeptide repeat protein [Candidatus Acidoferrales bacterium]|nr:tetratricopeptide repeat protein [Candidatus Acidoferrales bacterium]